MYKSISSNRIVSSSSYDYVDYYYFYLPFLFFFFFTFRPAKKNNHPIIILSFDRNFFS